MKPQLIWDLPTRLFHWLLVVGLGGQYVTAEWLDDAMQWHFYIGYGLLTLILFRLCWGLCGPRYARFSAFVTHPLAVLRYSRSVFSRQPNDYASHNPLGGYGVLVMLALVLVQAVSGLFMTDDIFMQGPWYGQADEATRELMNWLHHVSFDALLVVIALHLVAVAWYVLRKRQALVSAMVHGKKATAHRPIGSSRLWLALLILLLCCALTYYVVEVAPPKPMADALYY